MAAPAIPPVMDEDGPSPFVGLLKEIGWSLFYIFRQKALASPASTVVAIAQVKRELPRLGLLKASNTPTVLSTVRAMWNANGWKAFFPTVVYDTLETIPTRILTMVLQQLVGSAIAPFLPRNIFGMVVLSTVSNAAALFALYPLDTAQHVRMVTTVVSVDETEKFNIPNSVPSAVTSRGCKELYSGFLLSIAGIASYNVNGLIIQAVVPEEYNSIPAALAASTAASVVSSLLPYSIDTVRKRYRLAAYFGKPYSGYIDCAKHIVHEDGVFAFLDGFCESTTASVTAKVLSIAIEAATSPADFEMLPADELGDFDDAPSKR